jgi:hypothetical protein
MQTSFNIFLKLNPCFKFPWFSFCSLQPRRAAIEHCQSFHVSTESAWFGQEKTPGARSFRLNPPNSVISFLCDPNLCLCNKWIAYAHRKTSTVRFQWRSLYLVDNIFVDLSGFISVLWCNYKFVKFHLDCISWYIKPISRQRTMLGKKIEGYFNLPISCTPKLSLLRGSLIW